MQLARMFLTSLLLWPLAAAGSEQQSAGKNVPFAVTPAAMGSQLVRLSVPLPRGFAHSTDTLVVEAAGQAPVPVGFRVVSWYPGDDADTRSARRALITFPWYFHDDKRVEFLLTTSSAGHQPLENRPRTTVEVTGDVVRVSWPDREPVELAPILPPRTNHDAPRRELVESNQYFHWERLHFADPRWPRVIETRVDAMGGVVLVAHLQRTDSSDHFAPEIGWEFHSTTEDVRCSANGTDSTLVNTPWNHTFLEGVEASCVFAGSLAVYHPTAPLKRRGGIEVRRLENGRSHYRYLRCKADDRVPMQPLSWQRAEIVFAPSRLARWSSSLSSSHRFTVPITAWGSLYGDLHPLPPLPPILDKLIQYHRDAVVRSAAVGDDFGNVTGYDDRVPHGAMFGMNRLNHGSAIFEDAWRGGDRRLRETALLWCENFHDQSIWWGDRERGGTRYNNVAANRQTPPNGQYMWRSNDSVSFCTKGYDCFFLAWEETGDPRMLTALEAQVAYAASHLHAYETTCRNVGDVRDFIRLYSFTGERKYLDEALRLFRELRTRLSPERLFDEGGKSLEAALPFIEDDQRGAPHGYAKPYIIGYALAGLPELIALAPDEPELKETVRAVADFLARTVDPAGGWRYPHPRSSAVFICQAPEHAWQLTQAARALGPDPLWLDAIETVLRARIHGWRRTGMILNGLEGWEVSTGKVKSRSEINDLYQRPGDRDATRDYREGQVGYGWSPPEGLVYFGEVLGYYLEQRPVERLLAEPSPDHPLGLILTRSPVQKP